MNDQHRDDPALVDALISSYSILSLLHHRGATVDQPTRRTWRGRLIRPVAHGKLAGLDRMDVEEAMNKLEQSGVLASFGPTTASRRTFVSNTDSQQPAEIWVAHFETTSDIEDENREAIKYMSLHRSRESAEAALPEYAARVGIKVDDEDYVFRSYVVGLPLQD